MQWTKKSAHLVLQVRTQVSMSAWTRRFVTGIQTSGQKLKTRSSKRLKYPVFYALLLVRVSLSLLSKNRQIISEK